MALTNRGTTPRQRHFRVVVSSKHVLTVNEAHGPISLTRIEVDYVIAVTRGDPHECKRGGQTSTQGNLVMKIRRATGWGEIRPTQMFCRFAYKHGLVDL